MSCLAAEWRALPPLTRAGVLILLAGGSADLVAHGVTAPVDPARPFTVVQLSAHLVVLLGMLLTLIGIVLDAVLPPSSDTHHTDTRRLLDAHR